MITIYYNEYTACVSATAAGNESDRRREKKKKKKKTNTTERYYSKCVGCAENDILRAAFTKDPRAQAFSSLTRTLREALNQVPVVSRTSSEVAYTRYLNACVEGD